MSSTAFVSVSHGVQPPRLLTRGRRGRGARRLSPLACQRLGRCRRAAPLSRHGGHAALPQLETWLRIARVPYEVVNTSDPRKGPKGKLPFIEDAGVRIADTSTIVDHLTKTR